MSVGLLRRIIEHSTGMHASNIPKNVLMEKIGTLKLPFPIEETGSRHVDRIRAPQHHAQQSAMSTHPLARQILSKAPHAL